MTIVVAGIDVGKASLDVHAAGDDRRFDNDSTGFRALHGWLRKRKVERVAMEATGRFHRNVHRSLCDRGYKVHVANPFQARHFAEATGRKGKTDRVDARMLAAFWTAIPDLPATEPREVILNRLEDMLVMRAQQVAFRASTGQTAREIDDPKACEVAAQRIADFDKGIADLDAAIQELIESEPDYAERYLILLSIPGIGPVNAAALLCWMPELGHIENRQAAALLGVAPFARDSGQSKGARHIRGGRRRPRDLMYMAAQTAMRHNPEMKALHDRLKAAGKPHKVITVAVMRKLIVTANAMLRDRRTWTATPPAPRAAQTGAA